MNLLPRGREENKKDLRQKILKTGFSVFFCRTKKWDTLLCFDKIFTGQQV